MRYANRREEVLALLREYATEDGFVRMTLVAEMLLEPEPTAAQVAGIYRRARAIGLLPEALAADPRMVQLLAMDT